MNTLEATLSALRARGYRITSSRETVLRFLLGSNRGYSRQEIVSSLAQTGKRLDAVSVYRNLLWLEKEGLIHRLPDTNAYIACRSNPAVCHHHIVCDQCGAVEEVPCLGLDAMIEEVRSKSNFQVRTHQVELRGLCPECAEAETLK